MNTVNPHIRYAMAQHGSISKNKEFSICYDCRIFFAECAEGRITIDDTEYEISNGTAIYLPPRTKYRFCFTKQKEFKFLVFDFDLIQTYAHYAVSLGTATESDFDAARVPEYALPDLLALPIVKPLAQLRVMLSECVELFLKKSSLYMEQASALLKLCLIELVRAQKTSSGYGALCAQVQTYIFENYGRQDLTNTEIANVFNYHPYHLSRILKEETGKTMHQLLMDCRLDMAKNDLITTQYDIEQISWRCGFASTSYFIKLFREHTGVTPNK
ncbi:MAG: helix-turn-helix domain-containing protein, partial [Clostridia bacterium]|nr:helix-turn-helix domain-containing protein [Clostridia bacterium]